MCLSIHEADEIIALARKNNCVVAVDMHKRYDPDHLRIRDDIQKRIGAPLYGTAYLEEPLEVSTSTFKWVESSDPFSYVGPHWTDLIYSYYKSKPVSLTAVGQKKRLVRDGINAYDAVQVRVDFVGWEDHWFDANCERFGIKNFGGAIGPGVNGEDWHGQPLELPNSRKDVTAYFANGGTLKVWPLPGTIPPQPPTPPPATGKKTVDMILIDLNPGTDWWVAMLLDGTELTHITNGHYVNVLKRGSVPSVTTTETELLGMLQDVDTTNDSPFAPGKPAFNQALHDAWI
jgi:hypothetical protein